MSVIVLKQIIASLYKRKGKDILEAKEMELLISMELRWFDPNETRKLIEHAQAFGLLEEVEDGLKPNFDFNSIEIPLGFRPPKDLLPTLEQEQDSLFMQIVNHICMKTQMEPNQIIADINKKQSKFDDYILLEVLALLYAKELDVNIDEFIPNVKKVILGG